MVPPYHSALGHPGVHRNAKTVRHSTGHPRSLRCLRRVWAPMLVPPYTVTFQPSSSGTALVSRVIISRPSGASGVHEGSYDSGSQDIPILRGDQIGYLLKGITNTSFAHTCTYHRYLSRGMPRSHPSGMTCPKDSSLDPVRSTQPSPHTQDAR
jgi:hypothetical protein